MAQKSRAIEVVTENSKKSKLERYDIQHQHVQLQRRKPEVNEKLTGGNQTRRKQTPKSRENQENKIVKLQFDCEYCSSGDPESVIKCEKRAKWRC
ncbi:hypothetical protein LSH36_491g01023 [Paralvinella palmiformis]|uniref:Uncharacterized protein n=1 Tax=Paralvinella palmiformis TaxID=53620 RepID=A0AAD9J8R5_9ANNE|nr:hypothetical protein LSH36_491g01023 [Paralvinella palmiformis]